MVILGLHFGHDAAAALMVDGTVIASLEKERHTGRRRAATVRHEQVRDLLRATGVAIDDIDCCAVTTTQGMEILLFEPDDLTIALDYEERVTATRRGRPRFDTISSLGDPRAELHRIYTPDELDRIPHVPRIGAVEAFPDDDRIPRLGRVDPADIRLDPRPPPLFRTCAVRLGGRWIPGFHIAHHLAHAAYAFFSSPFERAAIVTHDGAPPLGLESGLFWYGQDNHLTPVAVHQLALGAIYNLVAYRLGLGDFGGAGKLMGLAPYGSGLLAPPPGDEARWIVCNNESEVADESAMPWLLRCLDRAREEGHDVTGLGGTVNPLAPLSRELAAGTQRLFEAGMLWAVSTLRDLLTVDRLAVEGLCLAGGAALNCPSNSAIAGAALFPSVSVLPGCNDEGLAVGSTQAVWHCVMGRRRARWHDAFCGVVDMSAEADGVGAKAESRGLLALDLPDVATDAARAIAAGEIVGWCLGRSELGPRALCHRSILADPTDAANWPRVNQLKGRERWRPLAPAVLESAARTHFVGCPVPSPFMLFNARTLTDALPAVTHVDGTARIQTVADDDDPLASLLREFGRLRGLPVLLNTSFNVDGRPMVERADDALAIVAETALDAVYFVRPDGSGVRVFGSSRPR